MLGSLISGFMGAATSLFNTAAQMNTAAANRESQEEINRLNIAAQQNINQQNIDAQRYINQQQLDYAKAMTQAQWERDDNAHQREVADLQAAGLSPLINATGSPVTSAKDWNPTAPHADPLPEARAYMAQAPQFDGNSIINAILQSKKIDEDIRQFDEKMIREDKSLTLTAQDVATRASMLDVEKSRADAYLAQVSNSYIIACKQLEQTKTEFKYSQDEKERESYLKVLSNNSLNLANAVGEAQKQGHLIVAPETDEKKYAEAMHNYGKALDTFMATKGISKFGEISAKMGTGASENGASSGFGFGFSFKPNSMREKLALLEFETNHPYPVFVYGYINWNTFKNLRSTHYGDFSNDK